MNILWSIFFMLSNVSISFSTHFVFIWLIFALSILKDQWLDLIYD